MTTKYVMTSLSMAIALAVLPSIALASSNPALASLNPIEPLRVTQIVNNQVVSTLANTHLSLLNNLTPTAAVPDSLAMNHIHLILRPSAARAAALQSLISAQHNPASSAFRQWITPAEFGEYFGAESGDVVAVEGWLRSQGFVVNGVYPDNLQIDFSGTAGQVRQTFHTQENRYTINQISYIANDSDISIPAALNQVVVGVAGLNNIRPQAQHTPPQVAQFSSSTQMFKIQQSASLSAKSPNPFAVSFVGGVRGFVPYDMNKIYNTTALYKKGMTGKGITIAVVEDGDMDVSDWPNFVSQFDLGHYGGKFKQFQPQLTPTSGNCTDPGGANPGGESIETVLDAEWSTAMAPSAHIWVATCNDADSNNFFGGVFTAADNLINGASRPNIISASYGYGEGYTDAASKAAIDLMWAQANAEGISVFVSSGDSGSNPSFNGSIINGVPAIDANSFATSPNDTAVGGTDFADVLDGTTKTYFASKLNSVYGSARSYVPEITWNQSCGNTRAAEDLVHMTALKFCKTYLLYDPDGDYVTSEAGSGGPSSVDRKPAWQRLVRGAAKDQSRDLPDVSLFAGPYGGYSYVILCTGLYPCAPQFTTPVELEGGTSLSSPMFAGIQALIDQGLSSSGLPADQGNAAPTLYVLASDEYGGATGPAPASLAACNANNGAQGTGKCVFHNTTDGGNSTQCVVVESFEETTPDCYFYGTISNFEGLGPMMVGLTSTSTSAYNGKTAAFAANAGWNFANGLGSVNANNLFAAWKKFVHAP